MPMAMSNDSDDYTELSVEFDMKCFRKPVVVAPRVPRTIPARFPKIAEEAYIRHMFSSAAAAKRRQVKRSFAWGLLKGVNAMKGCKAYRMFVGGKSPWRNIWDFLRYLPSDETRMVHAASFKCIAHLIPTSMLSPEVREWKLKQEQRALRNAEKFEKHRRRTQSTFDRKYIFKWWIFHCYVSFRGFRVAGKGSSQEPSFLQISKGCNLFFFNDDLLKSQLDILYHFVPHLKSEILEELTGSLIRCSSN